MFLRTLCVPYINISMKSAACTILPHSNAFSLFTYLCLQHAKETLLDPAKRANYDKWRNSGINISYKNWLGMKEHVHQVNEKYIPGIHNMQQINNNKKGHLVQHNPMSDLEHNITLMFCIHGKRNKYRFYTCLPFAL